jgi:hypothetical protein
MSAGVGNHLPFELEREDGDAVVAAFLGARRRQILAPGEAEMVGP